MSNTLEMYVELLICYCKPGVLIKYMAFLPFIVKMISLLYVTKSELVDYMPYVLILTKFERQTTIIIHSSTNSMFGPLSQIGSI